jgi:alkylated DNA repair dioxygenase AlkB
MRPAVPTREQWGDGVKNALLNVYPAGEGLLRHTDDLRFWTGWVLGFNLGSPTMMTFSLPVYRNENSSSSAVDPVDVWLPRRSFYVLTGAARYQWQHEIKPRMADEVNGGTVVRGRRTSLTLRGIAPCWLPSPPPAAALIGEHQYTPDVGGRREE